jgi:hypothetical protein
MEITSLLVAFATLATFVSALQMTPVPGMGPTATMPEMHITLMPRLDEAVIVSDPWQCATNNYSANINVPKPSGSLLTALASYGSALRTPCVNAGTSLLDCPFPAQESWCAFTTAAPTDVLPAYEAYGSVVASWWSSHSSVVESLARSCPTYWAKALLDYPGNELWLNNTIAFAECYNEAHPTSSTAVPLTTSTTTKPSYSLLTSSIIISPTTKPPYSLMTSSIIISGQPSTTIAIGL